MKITQYTESPNHKNEYKIINLIDKDKFDLLSNNPDEKEIYMRYGINKNEIKLIEEVTKSYESKKTKKKNNIDKNNSSIKNNNTNHKGGGTRSRKSVRRTKKNN